MALVIDGGSIGALGKQLVARQIEFPLAVAVCAWCRPGELGVAIGAVSHGICPRHLRKLKLSLRRVADAPLPRRRHRSEAVGNERLLFPL